MPKTIVNKASTTWNGDLLTGSGQTKLETSAAATFDMAWKARAEGAQGTNPEELIAAAHATCFSMALANGLNDNGTPPRQINTSAEVTFDPGAAEITGIKLTVRAQVPDISADDFDKIAEETKVGCPVSKALKAVPIEMDAELA